MEPQHNSQIPLPIEEDVWYSDDIVRMAEKNPSADFDFDLG